MNPARLSAALLLLVALAFTGCKSRGEPRPESPGTTATAQATPKPKPAEKPAQNKPKVSLLAKVLYWANPLNLLPKKAKPPAAQPARLLGVVKMVNLDDKYVLIDAVSQNTAPGDLLICIADQQETANLRMSSLKNPPFLIADIASGTPSVGDRVFQP